MARLFLDMDGTLAKFHDEISYLERMYEENFFANLAPFENMVAGAKLFMEQNPDVEVYVISSCVESPFCVRDKNKWLDKYLNVPQDHRIFPPVGASKADYIPGGVTKDDYLLDDYNRGLNQFMYDGGSAIKCHNNINQQGLGAYGGSAGNLWVGPMVHTDDLPEMIAAELAFQMGLDYDLETVRKAYPETDLAPRGDHSNPLDDIRYRAGKEEFFNYKLKTPDGEQFYAPGYLLKGIALNMYGDGDFKYLLDNDKLGFFAHHVRTALDQAQFPLIGRIDYLDKSGELDYRRDFRSQAEMELAIKGCRSAGISYRETWYVNTKVKAPEIQKTSETQTAPEHNEKNGSLLSKIANAAERATGNGPGKTGPFSKSGR